MSDVIRRGVVIGVLGGLVMRSWQAIGLVPLAVVVGFGVGVTPGLGVARRGARCIDIDTPFRFPTGPHARGARDRRARERGGPSHPPPVVLRCRDRHYRSAVVGSMIALISATGIGQRYQKLG